MPSGICIAPCCQRAWWDGPGRETRAPAQSAFNTRKQHKPEAKHCRAPKVDVLDLSALSPFLFLSFFSPDSGGLKLLSFPAAEWSGRGCQDGVDGECAEMVRSKEKENPYKQAPEDLIKLLQSSGRALPDSRLNKKLNTWLIKSGELFILSFWLQ